MSLFIGISVMALIFGGFTACFIEWMNEPDEYEIWMSNKSDVYLEVFGHKPMTTETEKLIDEALANKIHADHEQNW